MYSEICYEATCHESHTAEIVAVFNPQLGTIMLEFPEIVGLQVGIGMKTIDKIK